VLERSSAREREVPAVPVEGRTNAANAAIAEALVVSERAAGKHVAGVFTESGLASPGSGRRLVPAVLRCPES
jgi:hypothetical protein